MTDGAAGTNIVGLGILKDAWNSVKERSPQVSGSGVTLHVLVQTIFCNVHEKRK